MKVRFLKLVFDIKMNRKDSQKTTKNSTNKNNLNNNMSFPLFIRELTEAIYSDKRCLDVKIESNYGDDPKYLAKITIVCEKLCDNDRLNVEQCVLEMREDFGFGVIETITFMGHNIIIMCKKC